MQAISFSTRWSGIIMSWEISNKYFLSKKGNCDQQRDRQQIGLL